MRSVLSDMTALDPTDAMPLISLSWAKKYTINSG
jgi:hypothetical protein